MAENKPGVDPSLEPEVDENGEESVEPSWVAT